MPTNLTSKMSFVVLLTVIATTNPAFADPEGKTTTDHAFLDYIQPAGLRPYYLIDVRALKNKPLSGPLTVVFRRSGVKEPLFEVTLKKSPGTELIFRRRCDRERISPGNYSLSFYQGPLTTKDPSKTKNHQRNHLGALVKRFTFSVKAALKARVLAYYQEKFSDTHRVSPSIIVVGHVKGFPFQSHIDIRYRYGRTGRFSSWQKAIVNENQHIESTLSLKESEMTSDYVQLECSLNLAEQKPRVKDWFARNKGFDKGKRHPLEAITVILPIKKLGPFRSSLFRVRFGVKWNARLSFSGIKNGFPQGTRLDIRFAPEGNRQHIAWYRAINNADGSYHGQSSVFTKQLPPGLYKVQVWIKMRGQSRAQQRWFVLNKGWTRSHSELLKTLSLRIGSAAEERVFIEKTRATLLSFAKSLKKQVKAIEALYNEKYAGTMKENDKKHELILKALSALQRKNYNWRREYLALPFEGERRQIISLLASQVKLLRVCLDPEVELDALIKQTKTSADALIEKLQ
ncbi:MAG: hypothetical protein P1V97_05575 [Planctomycetota bacterium]|nr:hypothetical protein [Planctomycetota bacterium]